MKFFILNVPIYNTQFIVSVDQTDSQFLKSVAKENLNLEPEVIAMGLFGEEGTGHVTLGHVVNRQGYPVIFRLRGNPDSPKKIASMTHEVFHVVSKTLRNKGMTLVPESEEAYAYLLDYIVEQILERCKK